MTTAAPLQSSERILLLDIIRGISLCGILILNIYYFGLPLATEFNLRAYHETSFGNVATWYITHFLAEGSFRALFSMLFGAGCILLVSRLEQKDKSLRPADIYYTRIIWLLVFGMINTYVILWRGDILFSYAVVGFFIFPFRNGSPKLLLFMAVLFMIIFTYRTSLDTADRIEMKEKAEVAIKLKEESKTLTDEQTSDIKKLEEYNEHHKDENQRKEGDKEIKAFQTKSYPELFAYCLPGNIEWESTFVYKVLFFDVIIFVFFGMAFYKMGILTGEKPAWIYTLFVVIGYGFGFTIGYLTGHAWRDAHYDFFKFLTYDPFGIDLYQVRRLFVSLGNLGVIVLLYKSGFFGFLLKPFAAVGQMAFSNYLGQSIICTLFFYGYGLGYFGKLQRYELWYVVIAVWIFQIIFSVVWLRFFRFGPLEFVWRSLTYWKLQPLKRE